MRRFEREFWQATVAFAPAPPVIPTELAKLLEGVDDLLPPREVAWHAALGEPAVQIDLGPAGILAPPVDLLVGTSADGWVFQLNSQHLLIRHQQVVVQGKRGIPDDQLPTRDAFEQVVLGAIGRLPSGFKGAARRQQLVASYALFTGDEYPAGSLSQLVTGEGSPMPWPPADDVDFCQAYQRGRFETINGQRYAWNDSYRIGNWFNADGTVVRSSAIVRVLDLKTAVPEKRPIPGVPPPTLADLPPLSQDALDSFFSSGGAVGLRHLHQSFNGNLSSDVAPLD